VADTLRDLLRPLRAISPARAVAAAVMAPAAATLLALAIEGVGPVGTASVLLLAVVAAAAIGGLAAGLGAAVLAFCSLNFFFTPPTRTFRVAKPADLVALLVFLVVAAVVGTLLARALEDRARASRREEEAKLLNHLATRLLSGEPLARVLDDFAGALLEPFGLARSEIRAEVGGDPIEAIAERFGAKLGGPLTLVPIVVGEVAFGTLTAIRPAGAARLAGGEEDLLRSYARQVGIALERAELDLRVRGAMRDSESSALRAALFSSVTHDLRTPLASIKAGVTSLLDDQAVLDDAQRRDLLETVLEETDRLNRLVGNLLDLTRIRAGALSPATQPLAVDELVESVTHRLRKELDGLRVKTLIREDLPEVQVDPVQADQVLTNILENAIRVSPPEGTITISASPANSRVAIRVADDGPGIPPEERERVFEAFYRGPGAGTRGDAGRSGSGLGLAIAHAIVVAHGGRIRVEQTPAGGAALVVEFPVAEQAELAAVRPAEEEG
jgi:two-component system, OmpR family, sensor histidine kinase KdpD